MGSVEWEGNRDTLSEQLGRFVGTWEPSLAQGFLQYDHLLRAKARRAPREWGQKGIAPYWQELPRWLANRGGCGRDAAAEEFLETVIWGQTSLFYAVRLQDDHLDGHLPHTPLLLAPLLFLSEADRAFSSVIDTRAAFWNHYRLALQTTLTGIARVAQMQRDTAISPDDLLQNYGRVDAIFSVGSSSVCERMGRAEDIPRIDQFVSELGKVLLALDDLEDIGEDLEDGRLNFAARILLEGSGASDIDLALLARSWRLHARPEGLDAIRKALLNSLDRGAKAISPLGLRPAMNLISATRAEVQELRDLRGITAPG